MRPNGVHFDIKFDEGMFGGFPTAEKAAEFLARHPGEYTNLYVLRVVTIQGTRSSTIVALPELV